MASLRVRVWVLSLGMVACGGSEFDSRAGNVTNGKDGGPKEDAAGSAGGSASDGGASQSGAPGGGTRGSTGGARGGGTPGGGGSTGGTSNGGAPSTGGASNGGAPSTGGVATAGAGNGGTAGNPSTVMHASSYPQTCTYDGECAAVQEGEVCACPGCLNAAISATSLAKWNAERGAMDCPTVLIPCPAVLCMEMLPVCVGGTCAVRRALYIDPSQYDATCREDGDCRVIQGGEVCSSCKCGGTAINTGAYAQYLKTIEGVECTPGPSICDCATIDTAHCEKSASGEFGVCMPGSG